MVYRVTVLGKEKKGVWLKRMMILILLFMALLGGVLAKRLQLPQADLQQNAVSDLPDFEFPDVSGHLQSIKQWRNQVLVINFWATWCPPCLDELPDFNRLQLKYQDSGVQFIGVALDDARAVSDAVAHFNIVYPQLIAGDAGINLSKHLGNHLGAVPFTLVVDTQGRVIQRHPGIYESGELVAEIEKLIPKSP